MGVPPADTGPLTLHLLGAVDLDGVEGDVASRLFAQPRLTALLAVLAVPEPGRFVRRDRVVGLLWPDLDQSHARAALRKAVHAIRSALGDDVIVSRGDEDIALNAARVTCDAARFAAAIEASRLAEALDLYDGELMPGFHLAECAEFDRWLEDERAAIRERASGAAWALARRYEESQQLSDAAVWARRAVRLSWSDERGIRRALTMLERLGDRAGAVRLYDDFARRLKADLEVEPSPETQALAARLRA